MELTGAADVMGISFSAESRIQALLSRLMPPVMSLLSLLSMTG
jgi:hypothetical protein